MIFKSLFVSAKHSRPYINIGIHFDLINSKMTSSDAFLPTLPYIIALSERNNDFFIVPIVSLPAKQFVKFERSLKQHSHCTLIGANYV